MSEEATPKKPWYKRKFFIALAIFIGVMVAISLTSEPQTNTTQKSNTPAKEEPKAQKPYSTFGDGLWQVNTDIKPGVYKTEGGQNCYHARLSSFNETDIIANSLPSGPSTVEILPSDKGFKTSNCGEWVLAQ